jgi:hypothetical protein
MRLVQMPSALLHLDDADLDGVGLDPTLLAGFRAYLPLALEERRGLAVLAPADAGAHRLLMVLARRVGAALRDANIHLRDRGGDLKAGRKKLCYLPGSELGAALTTPGVRAALAGEAACFFQDLDAAWAAERAALAPGALLDLLDERLAAGRPTFLNAAPDRLPPGLAAGLRARLSVVEAVP